ncbi:MAG TPA: TonB-dependent receptor, partial [Casimicrobiaceae bacterium]|nr:TonB-dependent receptor [Casimicrobiaceae bacterium]
QPASTRTISGSNLLGRYSRDLGSGRSLSVQAYYDYTARDHPQSFHENLSTADIAAQYAMQPLDSHKLLLGGGYRESWDRVRNSVMQAFLPADRSLQWWHVFVQDDIALTQMLTLTAGAKVETNSYTGGEFLPNVRLAWRATATSLLWTALTRAVRAPSRFDRELYVPGVAPFALLQGDDAFKSEVSNVLEIGYRAQPTQEWSYSVTAFYHRHDRLRSYELVPGHPHWGNELDGHTHGVEGWTTWRAAAWWRITAGGVLLREHFTLSPASLDPGVGVGQLGNDPRGWWSLRSLMDLSPRHELDVTMRRVGARPDPAVPAYTAVDVRVGWTVHPNLQLSFVVQNALDPSHAEWGTATNRAEIPRAYFLKVLWQP